MIELATKISVLIGAWLGIIKISLELIAMRKKKKKKRRSPAKKKRRK
ncbi:hypothetical protein [Bacillus aerius]|nr:hypothetical protein [Bacillus aerius]MDH6597587.1 hypothetical protein [Bacillus aerius]